MVLERFFNTLFGWAIAISPLFGMILITFIMTLITTLAYKYFTDQYAVKNLREDMKKLQKEMKDTKDEKRKIDISKTIWEKNMETMKHSIKPMLITFLPIIVLFNWLRSAYTGYGILFLGYFQWLGTYILFSIAFSIILRKLFKVY